jgi:hypothetical protein
VGRFGAKWENRGNNNAYRRDSVGNVPGQIAGCWLGHGFQDQLGCLAVIPSFTRNGDRFWQ